MDGLGPPAILVMNRAGEETGRRIAAGLPGAGLHAAAGRLDGADIAQIGRAHV